MIGAALSIIVPVLNEAAEIETALTGLVQCRARGAEVIVVDGGSEDATANLAQPLADRVVAAPRGRALQMNAGAAAARGDVFLFLHADTRLPENADALILAALARTGCVWGRFDIRIGDGPLLGIVACMMNLRSRLTGIATGDQAIFVTRSAFERTAGFPSIPLMEDIALSTSLKRIGAPVRLRARVTTSSRRWRKDGVLRTIFLMWRLRLAYFAGADPAQLAQRYGYAPVDQ